VAAALGLSRDNFTLERASRTLAYCGDTSEVPRLVEELQKRFPEAALTLRIHVPVTGAAMAVRGRQSARALALLEAVRPYDHAPAAEFWPSYLRGLAYLQAGDGGAAIAQFQAIIERRGKNITSPLFVLAHLGLARAAALAGSGERARQAYETFLELWKDADSNLELIGEARRELMRLQ
jgi:tetratricopeptide (TPR) repeat protein